MQNRVCCCYLRNLFRHQYPGCVYYHELRGTRKHIFVWGFPKRTKYWTHILRPPKTAQKPPQPPQGKQHARQLQKRPKCRRRPMILTAEPESLCLLVSFESFPKLPKRLRMQTRTFAHILINANDQAWMLRVIENYATLSELTKALANRCAQTVPRRSPDGPQTVPSAKTHGPRPFQDS